MRRPACAPPPKIWISGSGSVTAPSPASERHRGTPRDAAAACATASDTATGRVAAEACLVRRAVERDQRRVDARPDRARRARRARARSSPSTFAMARVTSIPPKREPPSRRSIASREPRDAPAGAIARPIAPLAEDDLGLDASAGRANPRRGGHERSRSAIAHRARPIRRASAARRHRPSQPDRRGAIARKRAPRPSVNRRSDIRPATCRRCARACSPGNSAAARALAARRRLPDDVRRYAAVSASNASTYRARHCGCHAPLSSR